MRADALPEACWGVGRAGRAVARTGSYAMVNAPVVSADTPANPSTLAGRRVRSVGVALL